MAQQERRTKGMQRALPPSVQEGIPLWVEIFGAVRAAVLSFQHTVATRNDLGMLASIHNKFVRIATFRFRASLLEFLDERRRKLKRPMRQPWLRTRSWQARSSSRPARPA